MPTIANNYIFYAKFLGLCEIKKVGRCIQNHFHFPWTGDILLFLCVIGLVSVVPPCVINKQTNKQTNWMLEGVPYL